MKSNFPVWLVKKILKDKKEKLDNRKTQAKKTTLFRCKSTYFKIKGQTKCEHKHDIVYLGTCPGDNFLDNYIGESARRISERIIDHNGKDEKLHIFKHSCEKRQQHFHTNNCKIIANGFKNNNSFKANVH